MDACCGGTTVADGFTDQSHQKTVTANPTDPGEWERALFSLSGPFAFS
jgi:hypothetical protein